VLRGSASMLKFCSGGAIWWPIARIDCEAEELELIKIVIECGSWLVCDKFVADNSRRYLWVMQDHKNYC